MTKRTVLPVCFVAFALLAAAALYAHLTAAPACGSDAALRRVSEILRDQFHFDSTFVNNVRTVSGGYFSDSHECSAQVTQIRGNVSASDMPWRELRYWIAQRDAAMPPDITVKVGGGTPLAAPPPSIWKRLVRRL